MSLLVLLLVSALAAGSVIYLVTYAPLISKSGRWSPRLLVCKFLVPADIVVTTVLVLGPLFGGIAGIFAFVAGIFTSVGLSAGVVIVRRVLMPRWKEKYLAQKKELATKPTGKGWFKKGVSHAA
ncbi:MAG: hypothetical protein M0R76_02015 [Proteobacteria bacterium]|nr:hypothetical protein [Pseudomonadota bacterium]